MTISKDENDIHDLNTRCKEEDSRYRKISQYHSACRKGDHSHICTLEWLYTTSQLRDLLFQTFFPSLRE